MEQLDIQFRHNGATMWLDNTQASSSVALIKMPLIWLNFLIIYRKLPQI